MKISLPTSIKQLRLHHIEAMSEVDLNNYGLYDRLVLVCKLTGQDMETMKRVSLEQVNEIIDHYTNLIASHKKTELPKQITVNDREYCLIDGIGKQPLSWHIDSANMNTKDMAIVASFMYLEKGKGYCEMDKHKNIINPVQPRADWFREYMDAGLFIDINFFLREKSQKYRIAYTEIKRQRLKSIRKSDNQKNGIGK